MKSAAAVALMLLAAVFPRMAHADESIPRALQDWAGWVLKGEEFHRCPFLAGTDPASPDSYRCIWPERLQLTVDGRGGTFSQRWQVYAESWIALPGNEERWPQGVTVDGAPAVVVMREGRPYARLAAGSHLISGRFLWEARPEILPIPADTALVDLIVNGQRVTEVRRPGGELALGAQRAATEPRRLDVQIYRLIEDDQPLRLITRLRLRAAGDSREEQLARVLPTGFAPTSLFSQLPARLEPDGTLRVQVRPGRFELVLEARQVEPAATLTRPAAPGAVQEEVWSFAGNDRLRVASAEGAESVDPAQANVPADWRGYPAFRMRFGTVLRIDERSRGLANADQNQLHLQRRLWLDFNHEGFTALDELTGTLRRDWRLAMRSPYRLESARSGAQSLLVTTSATEGETGVELRSPNLELTTLSRVTGPGHALPATGWTSSVDGVAGELYLPPGHRLLAVIGADESPTAWLDRWGLWNLFGVLVVVVFSYWVAGPVTAAAAALALLLTYQAAPQFIWAWGILLVAIALARAAPEGRLRRAAGIFRTLEFTVLGLALVPFIWGEVRHAIYPQLEAVSYPPLLTTSMPSAQNLAAGRPMELKKEAKAFAPALPAPPPPPASQAAMGGLTESVTVNAARRESSAPESLVVRYAAGTLVQAGPGVPAWNYGAHPFSWSGPVEPDQTVRFVVIGPLLVALWRIGGVALLVLFFLSLARASYGTGLRWPRLRPSAAALAFLCAAVAAAPHVARADAMPDAALLKELHDRLIEPPRCAPTCGQLMQAEVRVKGDRLQVELKAGALAPVAIGVPTAGDRWSIDAVTVDGASSLAVARENGDTLWVPLRPGAHVVHLEGQLVGNSVRIAFPLIPQTVSVIAEGWDVAGVSAGRLVSGTLDLNRQRRSGAPATLAEPGDEDFPPFVRVTRDVRLDLDWSVATHVQRIAPQSAALTVDVPLLPGESVLSAGVEVQPDGMVRVGLSSGQNDRAWSSSLARADTLGLHLDAGAARTETWRFSVSPQWHASFSGVPAVLPEGAGALPWVFEFRPRPGERLEVAVSRPAAAPGRTLAIDSVRQSVSFGRRSSEHELELQYRSTEGGRHAIGLPPDINVTHVAVDGSPTQIRPDDGELSLPLLPGAHTVSVSWRSTDSAALAARAGAVDLRAPASNVTTTVTLSPDRWPLFALGRGVGPAFLYWGELIVLIVSAILLGRLSQSPLAVHEWLLLGLGLSTLSWGVLALVAVWLFAMHWREQWPGRDAQPRWRFNTLQVTLAALTLIAAASLIFSGVRYGLLASPDMGVVGPGSGGNAFSWFVDRNAATLPRPVVYSVPLWIYRALIFAWALWVAVALARWLRFAWRAWSTGGLWRGRTR